MTAAAEAAPPKPRSGGITAARITGWSVMGLWIVLGLALVWKLSSGFDPEFFSRYAPRMLGVDSFPFDWRRGAEGLVMTVSIVFWTMVLGGILSLPVAMARMSHNKVIATFAYCYVYFFRGTPLLAQTYLIYYGAGQENLRVWFQDMNLWWFFRDAYYCVVLAFTLNEAAYLAEIVRGAIEGVPAGQREAAKSLGLSRTVTFWKIIVPQAMIIALRPFGNEIIYTIKASAVASVVTVLDLMGITRLAYARSFNFDAYLWAALIYLAIVELLRRVWDKLEIHLTRHLTYATEK